ncbi:MAG: hypothetical protein Q9191_003976 [Dirinaria sp. TL-2023a]
MAVSTSTPLPSRLVGVSLKMYFDYHASASYVMSLAQHYSSSSPSSLGIFVVPSFPTLLPASSILQPAPNISLGAQDCHWEDLGPYTGCVSPLMLKQIGCSIVVLGHAERRGEAFYEDDVTIARKAQAVVRNAMVPLTCIGEKHQSKIVSEGVGLAMRECAPQVKAVLEAIPGDANVIFAYEPVWAIGAQEPASADHVCAVVGQLRTIIEKTGRNGQVKMLYGGSAGPGTWEKLKGDLDGLFLGRFAHDVEAMKSVVEEVGKE